MALFNKDKQKKQEKLEAKAFKKNNKNSQKYHSILKRAEFVAEEVLRLQEEMDINNIDFKSETKKLKEKYQSTKNLDAVLIDAFVLAYKAIQKIYDINLYKVQIMGGYVLHLGDVAEMKTGEGKTLTAILPAFLNSLTDRPVYVITVNEYLSQRDAFNTGKVFGLLGMSTGYIISEQKTDEKRENYAKDIIYTTNSEIGFDYLRDNMVRNIEDKTQRDFYFAIIDEADSILVDEARTPLIISQGNTLSDDVYISADDFVKSLGEEDFDKDNESRTVFLRDSGVEKAQDFFNLDNLYSFKNSQLVHRIYNALQANYIYEFDVDYTVKDDEIVLIDIFTGRLLHGRSYSEGLNQAIEAKERVTIKAETKTIASITYQNLFRMFSKLSGMTGTAATEEEEFINVYNMRVVPIPTNKMIIRRDLPDLVFATKEAKFANAVKKIKEIHEKGQPILVGTKSVYDSELISKELEKLELPHEILNAKNNAREAEIVSLAGKKGAITISTNMAGRGTDIKLEDGVTDLGGLFVLGTERYESRRIDNQLRGRSGRQGDPGISQFYISLEDEILLRAGLKRVQRYMGSLDNSPIESGFITRSITLSQKKIEGVNYDYRKSVIEYDDVLNRQRLITYAQRDAVLKSSDRIKLLKDFAQIFAKNILTNEIFYEDGAFDKKKFISHLKEGIFDNVSKFDETKILNASEESEIRDYVYQVIEDVINKNIKYIDKSDLSKILLNTMISIMDSNWQSHIDNLTRLRSGIHYRQYAQQNPVQVYILESNQIFDQFKIDILDQIVNISINFIKHLKNKKDVQSKKPQSSEPKPSSSNVKDFEVR